MNGCSNYMVRAFMNGRIIEKFLHEKLDDLEDGF